MNSASSESFADGIARELPYLRRYARALTGSQKSGDAYAAATLEAMLDDPDLGDRSRSPRVALFAAFHAIWTSSGAPVEAEEGDSFLAAQANRHMAPLTPGTREALLLYTIEQFSYAQIGDITNSTEAEAEEMVATAQEEMARSISGKVMVIEDEAIIAMDLETVVGQMGHRVTGVARTHKGAVQLAKQERPDMILADIQLADNSSGIDAVNDILGEFGEMPVIFITAFPERLLTGEKPEPVFLITKPYTEEQVRLAVSQAMFFASTVTLVA
ncbi:response regulator [Vannielia litorea]|uniref:response regulator n=1 Tax=Vannielia litorea TaxID=1217970 RepID=UPI001BD02D13|nr:response regulator [Vannielia litorea]MBS8225654.1 response regulator [Vannielia litorea]